MTYRWEVRSALRWGSKHERWFASEGEAMLFAKSEIEKSGNVGSVRVVDQVIYYDIHPEMA